MKFKKEEILLALRAVKFELNHYKKVLEKEENREEIEYYDPNDIRLLESFIIPALKKGLENEAFDLSEQMCKTETFIHYAISYFLNENADKLNKKEYGDMVKFYLKLDNRYISNYESLLKAQYWWENEKRIINMRESTLNNLKKWSSIHNFKVDF